MTYETVIGLEVHVQLSSASKLFCGCSTRFGAPPNTHVCAVCSGQPGVLPVLNDKAVELALRMALATGCTIRRVSRFARKNYFYPDQPKGYQISQYDEPIAEGGAVEIAVGGETRRIGITRIHVEEDAGKNIHLPAGGASKVDLNRAGVPLIEIVSEPEIRSPEEAAEYMRAIRAIARALGVSDGNMEQGSLRCDANVSLRPAGQRELGTRTELKNINSFKFVQRALEHEVARQTSLLERGAAVVQETRGWVADRGETEPLRSKEQEQDYRYFPEPDLPPLSIDEAYLERLAAELPELPLARRARLMQELALSEYDAAEITRERELADYLERAVAAGADPKRAVNWILSELLSKVADARDVLAAPVGPEALAGLLRLVDDGDDRGRKISTKLAKEIWAEMWSSGRSALEIATAGDLFQDSDEGAIERLVQEVLGASADKVEQYRAGKTKLLGYFVGQVMKASRGRAEPRLVNELLKKHLDG